MFVDKNHQLSSLVGVAVLEREDKGFLEARKLQGKLQDERSDIWAHGLEVTGRGQRPEPEMFEWEKNHSKK